MDKKLIKYSLFLKDGIIKKEPSIILKEEILQNQTIYRCKDLNNQREFERNKSLICLNQMQTNIFNNSIYVICIDDGTNTIENETLVKQLFIDYIQKCQYENEKEYNRKTEENNHCLFSIGMTFPVKTNFIDEIKKQAMDCKKMLTECDCIECLRFLSKKGYKNKIMVDINDNGLIPLEKAIHLDAIKDDCTICRIQLENYQNLGTVLYDFIEEKLYFSVFRGDEEYAIIEDTTLETLDEDYQAFLEKEEDKEIE